MIAEFREAIKRTEIKYKDTIFSMPIVKILEKTCEEESAELYPEAYEKSFSIPKENISKTGRLGFNLKLGKDLKDELEFTEVFEITFRLGDACLKLAYNV